MKTVYVAGLLLGLMVSGVNGVGAVEAGQLIAQNAPSSPGGKANAKGLERFQSKDYQGAILLRRHYVKAKDMKN